MLMTENMLIKKIHLTVCLLLMALTMTVAQQAISPGVSASEEADTSRNGRVDILYSDMFQNLQSDTSNLVKFGGNVELRQDSIFMYCDTAIVENESRVIAFGEEVLIQQGDSVSVFADSLFYDGDLREAELFGTEENPVILINGEQQIFTKRLHYDLNTKIATYREGATITNGETQISSKRGYFHVASNETFFKDSVVVIDPEFELKADTLQFNTETKVVTFLGPTRINSDTTKIYCESGFYDTDLNIAEFRQKAQFVKGEQKATADTIRYDGQQNEYILQGQAVFREKDRLAKAGTIRYQEESDQTTLIGNAYFRDEKQEIISEEILYDGENEIYSTRGRSRISNPPQLLEADQVDYSEELGMGIALGNVVWRDTAEDLTIRCNKADYNQKTGYLKAQGDEQQRPLLITMMQGDSLFLSADTLYSMRTDTLASDSSRMFLAYYDVRIFKTDLQAVCDSLIYSSTDSLFKFYENPIIWSDTSQFIADTIYMQLANQELDRIFLKENAFIVNSPDEIFFNQIKGKNVIARFLEGELRVVDVEGNAESVYYALDEFGAYIGANKTVCSEMRLFFGNNEVEKISFFTEPTATMYPMRQAQGSELELVGFAWRTDIRPTSIADILELKAKKVEQVQPPAETKSETGELLGKQNE